MDVDFKTISNAIVALKKYIFVAVNGRKQNCVFGEGPIRRNILIKLLM